MSARYRWENLISNIKKDGQIKKSFYHPKFIYISRPIRPYHFQADLIWCDGTFNILNHAVSTLVLLKMVDLI
jgi:hypothetical protein